MDEELLANVRTLTQALNEAKERLGESQFEAEEKQRELAIGKDPLCKYFSE